MADHEVSTGNLYGAATGSSARPGPYQRPRNRAASHIRAQKLTERLTSRVTSLALGVVVSERTVRFRFDDEHHAPPGPLQELWIPSIHSECDRSRRVAVSLSVVRREFYPDHPIDGTGGLERPNPARTAVRGTHQRREMIENRDVLDRYRHAMITSSHTSTRFSAQVAQKLRRTSLPTGTSTGRPSSRATPTSSTSEAG